MKIRKVLTLNDLYDYIKNVEVNDHNKFYPYNESMISLHIIDNQVEIINMNKILAVFMFHPETEKVSIVDVNYSGYPCFDDPYVISIHSVIEGDDVKFNKYLRHGLKVRDILLDILSPSDIMEIDDMDVYRFCLSCNKSDIAMLITSTNRRLNELNNLKQSYIRHSGDTISISKYMEDTIEDLCVSIDEATNKLLSEDIVNSIDPDVYNIEEIQESMSKIHDIVSSELQEVQKAKQILQLYN